jgi:hypothetical protein
VILLASTKEVVMIMPVLLKKKILDKTIINCQIWFENLKQIITLERIKGVE